MVFLRGKLIHKLNLPPPPHLRAATARSAWRVRRIRGADRRKRLGVHARAVLFAGADAFRERGQRNRQLGQGRQLEQIRFLRRKSGWVY